MKHTDVLKAVEAGAMVAIVEYRSGSADTINWRDAKGQALSANIAKHNVECHLGALVVSENLAEGADPSKFSAPFRKGERVVLELETLEKVKGFYRARGKLSPYEPSATKP